jgi:iron complex outermembrane receptor protein
MLKVIMTRSALIAFACSLSFVAHAYAVDPKPITVSAGDLTIALESLAKQAHVELVYQTEELKGMHTNGVSGSLTPHDAVTKLLEGTSLTVRTDSSGAMLIAGPLPSVPAPSTQSATDEKPSTHSPKEKPTADASSKSGFWDRFRLAQVDQGTSSSSASVEKAADVSQRRPEQLQEVVVTAQKREERLQDVPVPVTVIKADSLVDSNQLRIQDYYTSVPGLSVMPSTSGSGGSFQAVSIRGITTGVYTNPTVGIAVDDVPYGSSTSIGAGGGTVVADIDPADLARVEVLRGPQGTLYGASSMGGLLKYVTVDPSTDAVTARVEGDTSGVYHGAELGYGVRGSANVPLSDTVAVRASGFTRQDPGYIDNPVLHINGINEDHVSGGRLSALWRPSQAFSLKLSALYQDAKGDGFSDVDKPINGYVGQALGDLQQNYLRGTGGYDRSVQAYSAILTAKVGGADLTAVSGYNINRYSDSYDLTYIFGPLTQAQFGVPGTSTPEKNKTDKFTQEVRLSAPIGKSVDWLLGMFYTHENSQYEQSILAENPSTGATVGDFYNVGFLPGYTEYAAFTNLTFHVTDRFDVEIGGRESQIRQTYSEVDSGPFLSAVLGEPSPHVVPEQHAKADSFTYLATPRFKVSSDLMVYARLASGYRAGGPNLTISPGTPPQYSPDTTKNYEIGVKSDFLDHALSVDASLYYIDWKNIQLLLVNPQNGLGYNGNGSQAKSQGLELSVESRPLIGLTIAAWVAWGDAVLTQAFPTTSTAYGASGDRLPYSSRFSGNVSLRHDFPVTSRVTGFVGGSVSYVGDREGEFTSTTTRQDLPSFTRTDLQAGAKYVSWTVNFFVNNVADKRGLLAGGLGSYPPFAFSYIQPRTVGLSVVRTF